METAFPIFRNQETRQESVIIQMNPNAGREHIENVETLIEEAMRLAEEMGEPMDEESAGSPSVTVG